MVSSFSNFLQLKSALNALKDSEVLVIGDLILDRYVMGEVSRISPEAPIPVLKVSNTMETAGGAANVACNLAALGVKATLLGIIGEDKEADHLRQSLAHHQEQIIFKPFITATHPTIVKSRFVANQQQMLRCDEEDLSPLSAASFKAYETYLLDVIKAHSASIVILSDYGKGALQGTLVETLIKTVKKMGKLVMIDPKGQDYSRYAGADLITPNRAELSQATNLPCQTDEEIIIAAKSLIDDCSIHSVMATRSEEGMSLIRSEGADAPAFTHFSAQAQAVFDVAGAGDTVIASLAAGLAAGLDIDQAAMLANLAAGVVVGKVGTSQATAEEIIEAARRIFADDREGKLYAFDQAIQKAKNWQKAGEKIGFANGCFDLLHPGHISLIQQASEQCDHLIIGLNSDESVKRLKGATRPIQSAENRAIVLAALQAVDMVIIFEEDTPLTLIKALRPDCLIKGEDYEVGDIVGAKETLSWGGRVFRAKLKDGHSTTHTITKLKDKD